MRKKLIFAIALFSVLVSALTVKSKAKESEYAWYCVRRGNNQPEITESEMLISKYSGYSIDRSVSDDSDKRVIYLTFDAGYENGNVEKILDTLKEEGVPAAFFVLDNIIIKNTDIILRMADEGHLVCNHTRNHANICSMSKEEIKENLEALECIYKEKTGREMSRFFRFPEGKYSESALKHLDELGYTSVFWSFAYDDWDSSRQMNKEVAIKKIIDNTHNGAVMLFHPTSKTNAEIMGELIKEWRSMGYKFGTLEELCK